MRIYHCISFFLISHIGSNKKDTGVFDHSE